MDEQRIMNLKSLYLGLVNAIENKDDLSADKYSGEIHTIVHLMKLEENNINTLLSFIENIDSEDKEEKDFKQYMLEVINKQEGEWDENKIKEEREKLWSNLHGFAVKYLQTGIENEDTESLLDDVMMGVEDCAIANHFKIVDDVMREIEEKIVISEKEEYLEMHEWLKSIAGKRVSVEYLSVEVEEKEDFKFAASTMMFLPVIIMANEKTLEVPSVDMLEKIIKAEFHKRKIVDFNEVHLGTVVYSLGEVEASQFNDVFRVHSCVIDEVMGNIDENEKKLLKDLRQNTTTYTGDSSICFFAINLKINNSTLENISEKNRLFEKATSDKEIWKSVSKKLKNIYGTYSVLEPNYFDITKESLKQIKALALIKSLLKKNEEMVDVLYVNDEDEDKYYVFLVDKETGQYVQCIAGAVFNNKLDWLDELNRSCIENNLCLYKYKETIDEAKFKLISESGLSDMNSDLNDMLKNSTLVDDEWSSWTSVEKLNPIKTIQ